MIKVVIFDCDGVMFDSKEANIAYYNHILRELGLPPLGEEEVAFVHASTADQAVEFLLSRRRIAEIEAFHRRRRGTDYRPFIKLMKPEPHLREVLEALPPEVKKAISTNRTYTIGEVLAYHGLEKYFDLVVSALDVKRPKPHPDSLEKIIEHFRIRPDEALFVGDTFADEKAAHEAKTPFVAYKNPSLRADYHIEDLIELIEIVREPLRRSGRF
ncbi:MAG: HAD family hydrolase [Deltaproteobacteria bacterium]|nr:MAG: HAD family hydrolase [Deltaproteobacteria bacterium]